MSQSGFITPELVYIPAGPFLMGISESQINWLARHDTTAHQWQQKGYFVREQPQHTVTLPEYWIGRYPLTVGEFRPFIAAGGYQHSAWWTKAGWQWRRKVERAQPDYWDRAPWSVYDRLPLVGVSWYEADAFCRWLGHETGRRYRLPTEAEWEKAARCGDGRLCPWGDTFETWRANIRNSQLDRSLSTRSTVAELRQKGTAGKAFQEQEHLLPGRQAQVVVIIVVGRALGQPAPTAMPAKSSAVILFL